MKTKSIGRGLFLMTMGVLLSRIAMKYPEQVTFPEWLFGVAGIIVGIYGGIMVVDTVAGKIFDLFHKKKE